jgi:hypothetical protein
VEESCSTYETIATLGTAGYGKTETKMERSRTPWALKEQVLDLNLDYVHYDDDDDDDDNRNDFI